MPRKPGKVSPSDDSLEKLIELGSLRDDATYSFIIDQFRRHQVTSQKICRGENEMRHLGQTYLCYLESTRKHEELSKQYKGKGERSSEEAANLVGLSLPKTED